MSIYYEKQFFPPRFEDPDLVRTFRSVEQEFSKIASVINTGGIGPHNHPAADIISGTFDDARIAESNVTQHEGAIEHDALSGFVDDKHIDHSGVSISGGGILSGGGTIAASRTISLAHGDVDHNQLANTHNLSSDIDHDELANFDAGKHFTMLDEDEMTSNSDTKAATQQSIKAYVDAGGGGGTFLGLTDTPANYTGAEKKIVKVNATPNGLDFGADISDLENVDSIAGKAGKYARVKAGDVGIEWVTGTGGGATETKVSAYLGADQENIVTDTNTKVLLETENFDIGGDFDVANNKFVAPRNGYYFVTGQIRWKYPIQNKHTYGYVAKNGIAVGDSVATSITYYGGNWPSAHTDNISQLVYLLENDELFLCCRHNGGVNTPDIMSGKANTFLSVMEVV